MKPDAARIAEAARQVRAGRPVVFPTETVYGLGGDATNEAAVAAVFEAKGRPRFNPLIVHVADLETAEALAAFDARARRLAEAFWPGPLTMVLPRAPGSPVAWLASAGLDTVALRWPAHAMAEALIRAAGQPLVAPSANRSGRLSATTAADAAAELGDRVALVLDGGPCRLGLESTVVGLAADGPAALLRPGALDAAAIEALAGPLAEPESAPEGDAPRPSPGMLLRHYAPEAKLRPNAQRARPGEAMLGFGEVAGDLNLSPRGDLAEAAANLFAMLRRLDGGTGIAVAPVPERGLGRAINDRLRRAAAGSGCGGGG